MCCEYYLSDEVINLFIFKYCDVVSGCFEREFFYMLLNDIFMNFWESVVCNFFVNVDMIIVDLIFLFMYLYGNY